LVFLGILALFLLPLVLAWLMHTGTIRFSPGDTDNLGRLVIPPQPVDWNAVEREAPDGAPASLVGAWVVLFLLPEVCGEDCLEHARTLRQVHRAVGRQAVRIRIATISPEPPERYLVAQLREIHPQLHFVYRPGTEFAAALQRAAASTPTPSVYLVDPMGNIMMSYDAGDSMNRLRKDLEKLLTWSKLDQQP
jgi:peroxiredoxin